MTKIKRREGDVQSLLRQKGLTVGVIAADPTSPFSGGAILGDRIRMQQHYLDPGVFIRSMATKDRHGGLPPATKDVLKLMDAAGKEIILVETSSADADLGHTIIAQAR